MTQIIRPSGTTTNGGTGFHFISGGGTFHGAISDQSDSTFISGSASQDYGTIAAPANTPTQNTGHKVWCRGWRTSSGTGSPYFELYQGNPGAGGTVITTSQFILPTGSSSADKANNSYTLLYPEAGKITNYSTLYWVFNKSSGTATYEWYEFWLELPDPCQVALPSTSNIGSNGSWSISGTMPGAIADADDLTIMDNVSAGSPDDMYGMFSSLTDPVSSTGHVLGCRNIGQPGTNSSNVKLYQGNPYSSGTLVATMTLNQTSVEEDQLLTLSAGEANSITNYADLWWWASYTGGTHNQSIYEIWLEVPTYSAPPTTIPRVGRGRRAGN